MASWSVRQHWSRYWLLDPLDGTSAFLRGEADYCINVALIEHHKPVLGLVYGPHDDICYFASQDQGAFQFVNGHRFPLRPTFVQKNVLLMMSSRDLSTPAQTALTTQGYSCRVTTRSSALKFAMVASGQADIYLRASQHATGILQQGSVCLSK